MRYFLIFFISINVAFALNSCKTCHDSINKELKKSYSDIHYESKMFGEIQDFANKIDEPTCTMCHGGNSKTFDIKKAHKGAPKNHFGGLKIFLKNPENDIIGNEKICLQCHSAGN